ncbi:MAG: chorismate synthase [Thermodesulfovibrionia bacterium]
MNRLRFLTAGESHGRAMTVILEGIPSGLNISPDDINAELRRRQKGYGRGGRMEIEFDTVQILSGIRLGKTIGSPITLLIENRDWQNWKDIMAVEERDIDIPMVSRPRPGHADLSGAIKYDTHDIRDILERSSARETASRVAAGAVAKRFLSGFGIRIMSYVVEIGGIRAQIPNPTSQVHEERLLRIFEKAERSPVRCPDKGAENAMIKRIDDARARGDSIGGIFEVIALGVPIGLGSYTQWDKRLNARLAHAVMGIQAIKGVEIGLGFEMSRRSGSEVMDEILYDNSRFYRRTNNAGGIEGGISNGMPIIIRAGMKPIPTLRNPLSSVDIVTKKRFSATYERSDVCAVPSASIIAEAMTALVIADALLEKFGGDSMKEVMRNYKGYLRQIERF